MRSRDCPFEDYKQTIKQIPTKHTEFITFVKYLATCPEIDPSPVSEHILQFLSLEKLTADKGNAIYFALADLSMPDSFWTSLIAKIRQTISPTHEMASGMLYALSAAPLKIILAQFQNWEFLKPYLKSDEGKGKVKYAAFRLLHIFRNQVKFDNEIIDITLSQLTCGSPGLIFMVLNLVMFLIKIDYPNFEEKLEKCKNDVWRIVEVHGHMINLKHLAFIVEYANPPIQMLTALLPRLSISSSCYILAKLPSYPGFKSLAGLHPCTIIPQIMDCIEHSFSEGMRDELFISALELIKLSQNHHFFDRISNLLIQKIPACSIEVLSLFIEIAQSFNQIQKVLVQALKLSRQKDMFCDLTAVAAVLSMKSDVDMTKELVQLLASQAGGKNWRMAASCVAWYIWEKRYVITPQSLQSMVEVVKGIQDVTVKSIFLIYLSHLSPAHLHSSLVKAMRETIFPTVFLPAPAAKTTFTAENPDEQDMPVIVKVELVKAIAKIANEDEMFDIQPMLNTPLYMMAVKAAATQKQNSIMNTRRQSRHSSLLDDRPPVCPFSLCGLFGAARVASAMSFSTGASDRDVMGVSRPFVEISPAYHALTVEMSSTIVSRTRSLSIDLRLSTKRMVPNITVDLDVPLGVTPSHAPEWYINEINEKTKVTHRYSFTVNSMVDPYVHIRVRQGQTNVMDLKVCLPLIDMCIKAEPNPELAKVIWHRLTHESENEVDAPDGVWVCGNETCIVVRRNIARSNRKCYLNMLPSVSQTRAVIE